MAEPTLLILGGTSLAVALARAAASLGLPVIYSLAGRTTSISVPEAEVRVGGFGGADALAEYLRRKDVLAVVDATHAYAARISENAWLACQAAERPLLRLQEPPWRETPGDHWQHVPDITAARDAAAKTTARVLISTGRQALAEFADDRRCWWLARVIAPGADLPALCSGQYVFARGPFDLAGELALLREHRISAVISKNAGSAATYAKIAAARELGLPVIMIARPGAPATPLVETVAEAMLWLRDCLG
ncbi:MAG: cobalt-precorrin-6A reductase [Alphaproteobacteria bacterium]|jgi:precorrin-6A/cobalt-precorrin-6A reductase|nr:cobalt-precorrin-6A reductase [Alphaproteobacteria bacterium]